MSGAELRPVDQDHYLCFLLHFVRNLYAGKSILCKFRPRAAHHRMSALKVMCR